MDLLIFIIVSKRRHIEDYEFVILDNILYYAFIIFIIRDLILVIKYCRDYDNSKNESGRLYNKRKIVGTLENSYYKMLVTAVLGIYLVITLIFY